MLKESGLSRKEYDQLTPAEKRESPSRSSITSCHPMLMASLGLAQSGTIRSVSLLARSRELPAYLASFCVSHQEQVECTSFPRAEEVL